MNKQDIYNLLDEKGIEYKAIEHTPVYTVDDIKALNMPNPEAGAKNLFLCDDKKRSFYLVVARDELPVNLKDMQARLESRRLRFANEQHLLEILGLTPGSVTPFGALNDEERKTRVAIDAYYENNLISVHPNDNTATVYLNCNDLVALLQEHGSQVEYLNME